MKINLRAEAAGDEEIIELVIKEAFQNIDLSDQTEHKLVSRLRNSKEFISSLSIVAEVDGNLVGHILLSKMKIVNEEKHWDALTLAPVSVLPVFQNKGVGSALIKGGHMEAKELGYELIALIGHEDYYPRFGYQEAILHDIKFPFEAPSKNCMVKELKQNTLKNIAGMIEYPAAFFG